MLQVLDPQGGIYALACLSERKLYIGSSADFRTRLIAHKSDLRTGRHPNQPLQEAFDKFGEKSFRCWILADNKTNCGTCVLSDELLKSIGYLGGEWREYYVISSLPYQSTYNISKPYYSAALFKKAFVVTEDFGEVLKNLNEFVLGNDYRVPLEFDFSYTDSSSPNYVQDFTLCFEFKKRVHETIVEYGCNSLHITIANFIAYLLHDFSEKFKSEIQAYTTVQIFPLSIYSNLSVNKLNFCLPLNDSLKKILLYGAERTGKSPSMFITYLIEKFAITHKYGFEAYQKEKKKLSDEKAKYKAHIKAELNEKAIIKAIYIKGISYKTPEKRGGWAVVVYLKNGFIHEMGGSQINTTSNRMEIEAAIEALKYYNWVGQEKGITIYTDSRYIESGASEWVELWKERNWVTGTGEPVQNQDLWLELDRVNNRRIYWRWVKGQSGDSGNERAKEIAMAFACGDEPTLKTKLVIPTWLREIQSQT